MPTNLLTALDNIIIINYNEDMTFKNQTFVYILVFRMMIVGCTYVFVQMTLV